MSLTNPNTPVSQQDLKDLYEHKLLPYLGGAFGLVATGIDSANLYSTTERVIGQWIDGKPLYQKTVQSTAVEGINTINHNISNVDYIFINKQIITYNGTEYHLNGQLIGSNGYSKVDRTSVTINSESPAWIKGCLLTFTLQYTKTTDSAVESYGTDTTYSTDEHVVGSWIDGSPVYQKTILFGNLPNNSAKKVPIGINNIDKIVDFKAIAIDENNAVFILPSSTCTNLAYAIECVVLLPSNEIQIITAVNRSTAIGYITVQYTKTS